MNLTIYSIDMDTKDLADCPPGYTELWSDGSQSGEGLVCKSSSELLEQPKSWIQIPSTKSIHHEFPGNESKISSELQRGDSFHVQQIAGQCKGRHTKSHPHICKSTITPRNHYSLCWIFFYRYSTFFPIPLVKRVDHYLFVDLGKDTGYYVRPYRLMAYEG
jgi:hypothetical protein